MESENAISHPVLKAPLLPLLLSQYNSFFPGWGYLVAQMAKLFEQRMDLLALFRIHDRFIPNRSSLTDAPTGDAASILKFDENQLARTNHGQPQGPSWQTGHQGYKAIRSAHRRPSCRRMDPGADPGQLSAHPSGRHTSLLGLCSRTPAHGARRPSSTCMRFVAEENFLRKSLCLLRQSGFDVSSIAETCHGRPDTEVLAIASAED